MLLHKKEKEKEKEKKSFYFEKKTLKFKKKSTFLKKNIILVSKFTKTKGSKAAGLILYLLFLLG
jgi:hypothetical protein